MPDSIRALLRGLAVVGFALSGSALAQAPITLHGAVQFNDDHAFNRALVRFQELTAKYYGKRMRRFIQGYYDLLVFALAFVWYGIKFMEFGWSQTSELADMPMTFIFIAWPLTGLTWLLFGGERMLLDLRTIANGPGPGDPPPTRGIGTGSVI